MLRSEENISDAKLNRMLFAVLCGLICFLQVVMIVAVGVMIRQSHLVFENTSATLDRLQVAPTNVYDKVGQLETTLNSRLEVIDAKLAVRGEWSPIKVESPE